MIDGVLIGKASVETLSLFHTLIEMMEAAEKEGHALSLEQVMAELPPNALKLANAFVADLKELKQQFEEAFKTDPKALDKSLSELQRETWWWRLKRYKLLRNFSPTIEANKTSLGLMLGDFVALANCRERDELVAQAFEMSEGIKAGLAARCDLAKFSVRTVLQNLIDDAESVCGRLRKMVGRKVE